MSIISISFPECDVCGEKQPDVHFDTVGLCRADMQYRGWKRHDGMDYCPDCADRLLNEKDRQLPPYAKAKS